MAQAGKDLFSPSELLKIGQVARGARQLAKKWDLQSEAERVWKAPSYIVSVQESKC